MTGKTPNPIRLPWSRSCFVCGEANPQEIRAQIFKVGGLIEMRFVPPREFVGWRDVVHGGLVGTVLDELMTWAAIVQGRQAYFAVEFSVRFKAPLMAEHPCQVRARTVGARRQILDTEAWIEDDAGTVFARATGRYLPVPSAQLTSFRHDFIWGEDGLDLRSVLAPGDTPGD